MVFGPRTLDCGVLVPSGMQRYTHIYMHSCVYACIHTCIHTYIHKPCKHSKLWSRRNEIEPLVWALNRSTKWANETQHHPQDCVGTSLAGRSHCAAVWCRRVLCVLCLWSNPACFAQHPRLSSAVQPRLRRDRLRLLLLLPVPLLAKLSRRTARRL